MKREILIVIITIIITAGITRTFFPKVNTVPTQPIKTSPVKAFETIDCKNCNVLRITESVWNGRFKAEPDKVWEIEARPGMKTSTADWSLEILSVSEDNLKIKFSGKIYQDLAEPVTSPVVIKKWSKGEDFSDGRVGGGTVWEFVYFQKTN